MHRFFVESAYPDADEAQRRAFFVDLIEHFVEQGDPGQLIRAEVFHLALAGAYAKVVATYLQVERFTLKPLSPEAPADLVGHGGDTPSQLARLGDACREADLVGDRLGGLLAVGDGCVDTVCAVGHESRVNSEDAFQDGRIGMSEFSERPDMEIMKPPLGDRSDATHYADGERGQEGFGFIGIDEGDAMRFVLVGGDFCHRLRSTDADRACDAELVDARLDSLGDDEGMGSIGSCRAYIEKRFVDADLHKVRRLIVEDLHHRFRHLAIAMEVSGSPDGVGAESSGHCGGHRRMDAVVPRLVGRGRYDSSLVGAAANDDRLAPPGRVVKLFD